MKAKEKILRTFGADFYREVGRKGGSVSGIAKGFALNPKLASEAGRKAGSISKRGYKFIGEDNGYRLYLANDTGKVVKYKYGSNSQREDSSNR